jgi:hypothetical protein
MVLIRSNDSAEVQYELERYPEICYKAFQSFMQIEWSSFSYQVNLGGLEAAKDDSTLVGQHAVGSVEA